MLRAERHYLDGQDFERRGILDQALENYVEAAEINPFHPSYQRAVGNASLALHQPGSVNLRPLYQANSAHGKALELDPLYPYHWFEKAQALRFLKLAGEENVESPERYFKKAVEIDPTNPRFLRGLMVWEIERGNLDTALYLFKGLASSVPEAITLYGPLLLKTDEDIADFESSLGERPVKKIEFATFLARVGKKDRARQYLANLPDTVYSKWALALPLADAYIELEDYREAGEVVEKALDKNPQTLAYYFKKARICEKMDDIECAIDAYQRAAERFPAEWEIRILMARLAERINDDDTAFEAYDAARKNRALAFRYRREVYTSLGEIEKRRGNYENALKHYREALELFPEDRALDHEVRWLEAKIKRVKIEEKLKRRPR